MEFFIARDAVLSSVIREVYRKRGALFFEVRAIVVSTHDPRVRLVDAAGGLVDVGSWRVTDPADIPDIVRLLKAKDPYLAGCVFLDTGEECVHVDDDTLEPCALFGKRTGARYSAVS